MDTCEEDDARTAFKSMEPQIFITLWAVEARGMVMNISQRQGVT